MSGGCFDTLWRSWRTIYSFVLVDILHKIIQSGTTIAAGHHPGLREVLEQDWSENELVILRELSPRKQREWMASRALLYQIAGLTTRIECLYDDFGKPYLLNSERYISVSHSDLWCSAMISDKPCGIDIQGYSPTLERIATRFLTEKDLKVVNGHPQQSPYLHILWGAKESMYKAYGRKKLGFREHIFVSPIDWENKRCFGAIKYEGIHLQYEIGFRLLPEVAWVFCQQRDTLSADPG